MENCTAQEHVTNPTHLQFTEIPHVRYSYRIRATLCPFLHTGRLEMGVKHTLFLFAADCYLKEGMPSIIQDWYNHNVFQEGVPSILFVCLALY